MHHLLSRANNVHFLDGPGVSCYNQNNLKPSTVKIREIWAAARETVFHRLPWPKSLRTRLLGLCALCLVVPTFITGALVLGVATLRRRTD